MSTATLERPVTDRPATLDEAAFGRAWYNLHPQIIGYLRTRLPVDAVEDVAQETFLRAWNARSYRPDLGSLQTWMYTIAGRLVADHYRTAARRPTVVTDTTPDTADESDIGDLAAGLVDNAAAMCRVRYALAALPERQRQVVVARYLHDLPIAEVAIRLRVPHKPGTVKSLASRGLVALRNALAALPAVLSGQPPALPAIPDAPADPARVALASLPTPESRSAHACSGRRPRLIRRSRSGGLVHPGLVDGTSTAPRAAAPPGSGNVRSRHCGCTFEPGNPRVEATGPPGGNPRRLGAAQHGAVGPGTPHRAGRAGAAAAGAVVSALAMWLWVLLGGVFLGGCVALWLWVTRDPDRGAAAAATAAVRRSNEDRQRDIGIFAIFVRTPVGTDPVAVGTATPTSPGVGLGPTVRLAPEPRWAQPIPQAVLDHVQLQRDAQQDRNTGRHWRAEP